jgi:hypothetical protein
MRGREKRTEMHCNGEMKDMWEKKFDGKEVESVQRRDETMTCALLFLWYDNVVLRMA